GRARELAAARRAPRDRGGRGGGWAVPPGTRGLRPGRVDPHRVHDGEPQCVGGRLDRALRGVQGHPSVAQRRPRRRARPYCLLGGLCWGGGRRVVLRTTVGSSPVVAGGSVSISSDAAVPHAAVLSI